MTAGFYWGRSQSWCKIWVGRPRRGRRGALGERTLPVFHYANAPLLLALLLCCAPEILHAEAGGSWTNRAGHALQASPQSISGQMVTFVQTNTGKTASYPLSVFLPTEQERLRCRLKDTTLPEGLKAAREFSARVIKRSRLLNQSGGMSEKDLQQAVAETLSAFREQAAPFIAQQQLSPERLELIVSEMVADKKQ